MKPSVRHSQAETELLEAMEWYDEKQFGLGHDLMAEVERAIKRIEKAPRACARYRSTKMRFRKLRRFPYIVYYQELPNVIWIAAIAHASRRPGYWKRRKPE